MKISIFNNRYVNHPKSGGAEVFTHQVAKRMVERDHHVTVVCSGYEGSERRSIIEGVEVIRLGNEVSIYPRARLYYSRKLKGSVDVVIDEYTSRPFLTPKFVEEPIYFLVHELAREKYFHQLPPILSHILYYYLEPRWIRKYVDIPTITVSESTKSDLQHWGLTDITIVPEGIEFSPRESLPEKESVPTFLFVGLLKELNLVHEAIEAFSIIEEELNEAKLWIAGKGEKREELEQIAEGHNIEFLGYVSEDRKRQLMSRAHGLLVPAIREGWGLVVTEANACGTPAIGYDVHGLRDSIRDGETGVLVDPNPDAMARAAINLIQDYNYRNKLARTALSWSRSFAWENTTDAILEEISQNGPR